MRMWPEHLQRVERYYDKIQGIVDRTVEPMENRHRQEGWYDEFLAFFLHCYHLKDWLAKDNKYRPCDSGPTCQGPKPCSNPDCSMGRWLGTLPSKPPNACKPTRGCASPTCPECFIKCEPALDVCGGIANGIKHLVLDRDAKRRRFMVGRGFNRPEQRCWFFIVALDEKAVYRFTREMEYRDHGDPMEIADAAISAWRAFVQRGEGIASEDEYRQWLDGGGVPWYEFKRGPSKETQPL